MRRIFSFLAAVLMITAVVQADEGNNSSGRFRGVVADPAIRWNAQSSVEPGATGVQDLAIQQNNEVTVVTPLPETGAVPVQADGVYGTSRRQRPSVLGRLVELERRKNAWLRSRFR